MVEINIAFRGFDDWQAWAERNAFVFDRAQISVLAERIRQTGFREPLTGAKVYPNQIEGTGDNFREGLAYRGVNSRARAVLHSLEATLDMSRSPFLRIFAPEAVTPFALRLLTGPH